MACHVDVMSCVLHFSALRPASASQDINSLDMLIRLLRLVWLADEYTPNVFTSLCTNCSSVLVCIRCRRCEFYFYSANLMTKGLVCVITYARMSRNETYLFIYLFI